MSAEPKETPTDSLLGFVVDRASDLIAVEDHSLVHNGLIEDMSHHRSPVKIDELEAQFRRLVETAVGDVKTDVIPMVRPAIATYSLIRTPTILFDYLTYFKTFLGGGYVTAEGITIYDDADAKVATQSLARVICQRRPITTNAEVSFVTDLTDSDAAEAVYDRLVMPKYQPPKFLTPNPSRRAGGTNGSTLELIVSGPAE